MSKQFLTQFPFTYADSIRFENIDRTFKITITNSEQKLLAILKNILTFNFSKDSLDSDEDYIDIIWITHEYRKPTQQDLRSYSFGNSNINELPALHIITFYGASIMEIICEEVEVKALA